RSGGVGGARMAAAVARRDGDDRARLVALQVFSRRIGAPHLVEQGADSGIVDLVLKRVRPREIPIRDARGGKIRRAVGDTDEIGWMLRASQCHESRTGDSNRLDFVW